MHHFDLLGEVFGCTTLERILHALKLATPREVNLFVVIAPFRVCSRRVYDDELKIVVEPAGRPQTLERREKQVLSKTVYTSSQKEHRYVRRS